MKSLTINEGTARTAGMEDGWESLLTRRVPVLSPPLSPPLSAQDIARIADAVAARLNAAGNQEGSFTAEQIAKAARHPISKKSVRRLELRGLLVRVEGFKRPALYTRASVEAWLSGRR